MSGIGGWPGLFADMLGVTRPRPAPRPTPPPCRAVIDALPPEAKRTFGELQTALPDVRIALTPRHRSLLGLRRTSAGALLLRLHPVLLYDADCSVLLSEWVRIGGQNRKKKQANTLRQQLNALLHRGMQKITQAQVEPRDQAIITVADLLTDPVLTDHENLLTRLAAEVHARWFSDLPPAPVSWGRLPPRRRLTHLRFGCYRRRTGRIEISPRLARPWISLDFLRHVLHHEYCHHRQAMQPQGREGAHSPRFRAWEREFPALAEARRWERLCLPWLLDDTPPPWYGGPRSAPPCPSAAPAFPSSPAS